MEQKTLERRAVLKGGVAAVGLIGSGASAAMVAGVEQASGDAAQSPLPQQVVTAIERFRASIPPNFDPDYVEKAVIPFFLTSFYEGERPMLPMIGVNFSKENALPYDLWGLIYHDWRPTPEEGVTVFLQGLEKRGDNNLRKRIYFSAMTPDLYNGGSISAIHDARTTAYGASPQQKFGLPMERHSYISTPHTSTSLDPVHWKNPNAFDPQRYLQLPTSAQINDDKCRQIGLARCPFDITSFEVKDGRKANITNSGFGTVFGVVDGTSLPVCDYAGFAPFGFGYRRCPGEQLTIHVFEDFLRKVWRDKIVFRKLNLANPGRVPIGPTAVIQDDLGFSRSA